jgi:hypothetical protein
MPYTITKTDGTTLLNLADGLTDETTTSLVLIGKNYSNSAAPDDPLTGQLWYDSANKLLKVFTGTAWKVISSSISSSSAPADPVVGDLWWDTTNTQLKVYSGTSFVTIGPAFTATSGQTGAIADVIADNAAGNATHVVVKFFVNNQLTSILSRDAEFTPLSASSAPGFTSIKPGFNLSTSISGLKYWGNADNATSLNGVAASAYATLAGSTAFTAAQSIQNNSGLTVGASNDFALTVTGSASNVSSVTNGNALDFYVKVANTNTKIISLTGTGKAEVVVGSPTTTNGIATKGYVDAEITTLVDSIAGSGGDISDIQTQLATYLKRDGTNEITGSIRVSTGNSFSLGNATHKFNTIYASTFSGTSTQAQYADLAERFASDATYAPGTVVALGGVEEITKVGEDLSDEVFGVVSSRAAYLMNAGAGDDQTHPAIAVSGRVPVTVVGQVNKGDRLVSAGNGRARAASKDEITPWNVIGRSLEDKWYDGLGSVEAIVKLTS